MELGFNLILMSQTVICCIKTIVQQPSYRKMCCITSRTTVVHTTNLGVGDWVDARQNVWAYRVPITVELLCTYNVHSILYKVLYKCALWAWSVMLLWHNATRPKAKMKNVLTWSKWTWNCIVIHRENRHWFSEMCRFDVEVYVKIYRKTETKILAAIERHFNDLYNISTCENKYKICNSTHNVCTKICLLINNFMQQPSPCLKLCNFLFPQWDQQQAP